MSKQKDRVDKENIYDDGTYVVHKSRKKSILMFVVCLLIAFVIWIYVSNKERHEMLENETSSSSDNVSESVQLTNDISEVIRV